MSGPLVVVDSAVWIDHINRTDEQLFVLLNKNRAAMHPMVYGEIALGSLRSRETILGELREVPQVPMARHVEVLALIEQQQLFGKGVGLVDACLLAATRLLESGTLFTRDKRLYAQAERIGLAYVP